MIWLLAVTVWITLASGLYLVLSRDILRCVLGLALLASGVNLVLFASGRIGPAQPAVIPAGALRLGETAAAANPLPQALVLTAIVIGFALVCFALALALVLMQRAKTEDVLALRHAEPVPRDPVKPPLTHPAHEPVPGDTPAAQPRQGVQR